MNELMVIFFGLAVIRAIVPLADPKNYNVGTIFVSISTSWAFYHLVFNCGKITIGF
tara:strand:- start:284 stop:451 length:168 start_codon:yes stop_codon:yes gene_type:complete